MSARLYRLLELLAIPPVLVFLTGYGLVLLVKPGIRWILRLEEQDERCQKQEGRAGPAA